MPTVSVFCGVSLDGFLARADGTFDFLDEGGSVPHGYTEFMATVDTLLIGRNTWEVVAAFPEWPYEKKRVMVLSSSPIDLSTARGAEERRRGLAQSRRPGAGVLGSGPTGADDEKERA